MLLALRLIFGLLLVAGLLCFAAYAVTGHPGWRQRGVVVIKWTLIAGAASAAVIVLEHLAVI